MKGVHVGLPFCPQGLDGDDGKDGTAGAPGLPGADVSQTAAHLRVCSLV